MRQPGQWVAGLRRARVRAAGRRPAAGAWALPAGQSRSAWASAAQAATAAQAAVVPWPAPWPGTLRASAANSLALPVSCRFMASPVSRSRVTWVLPCGQVNMRKPGQQRGRASRGEDQVRRLPVDEYLVLHITAAADQLLEHLAAIEGTALPDAQRH